uniref:Uncharacterized protein n=1 Tax=Anguilla anguilla TaxID=7936 RepID=A0A0E9WHG7_ANGAN
MELRTWVALEDRILVWFNMCLDNFQWRVGEFWSSITLTTCRVHQGTILEPVLFSDYMVLLGTYIIQHLQYYLKEFSNTS